MKEGWISIHRKMQNHWLFTEKRVFSRMEAWIDILMSVNHSEGKVLIKNDVFIVDRGESLNSLETWANRWDWNKSKVRRFFDLLESDSMIKLVNEQKSTRLIVLNYDSYQSLRNADETQMKRKRNVVETELTPNNNDNKENNSIKQNNIKERKEKFSETLKPFLSIYGKETLNDFYKYWTEENKSGTKFKQEGMKTWSVERRLETWARNEIKFGNNGNTGGKKQIKPASGDEQIQSAIRKQLGIDYTENDDKGGDNFEEGDFTLMQ